jgi:flagellar basal-body rod modification protein FlgD
MTTISPAIGAATTESFTTSGTSGFETDFNNFVKLLTAQVQYQDPLEPMDSSTFITQLSNLSQVEQQAKSNGLLEQITGQLGASGSLSDVGLIGRTVQFPGSTLSWDGAAPIDFSFEMDASADEVAVEIIDDGGNVVRTIDLGSLAGLEEHDVTWDGVGDQGIPMVPSDYQVRIAAMDPSGDPIGSITYRQGIVQEVGFKGGASVLVIEGSEEISSALLRSVSQGV